MLSIYHTQSQSDGYVTGNLGFGILPKDASTYEVKELWVKPSTLGLTIDSHHHHSLASWANSSSYISSWGQDSLNQNLQQG